LPPGWHWKKTIRHPPYSICDHPDRDCRTDRRNNRRCDSEGRTRPELMPPLIFCSPSRRKTSCSFGLVRTDPQTIQVEFFRGSCEKLLGPNMCFARIRTASRELLVPAWFQQTPSTRRVPYSGVLYVRTLKSQWSRSKREWRCRRRHSLLSAHRSASRAFQSCHVPRQTTADRWADNN